MAIEIKVPMLPESVADATISAWHKKVGDSIKRDENLVDLETDKVVLEVPAIEDGVITAIHFPVGSIVNSGQVLATIEAGVVAAAPSAEAAKPAAQAAPVQAATLSEAGPSARRAAAEQGVDLSAVTGSGRDGRVTKDDVIKQTQKQAPVTPAVSTSGTGNRTEQRVPMSRLRARIAERLVESQQTAAILTTFNEINMSPVMELRKKYKDAFEKRHNVRLGFMSFFTKAVVEALKRFPAVNASLDGTDILYHGYCDIGIAVSSPRGLVVPILRNAESMSLADIERAIAAYGEKAKEGKLTVEEMTGGTFTISNGGVFGSLLSTPIINPPQSGILGMHKIEERAVVENGQIVIRPMMYVALSYDHRMIDGKESVSFLVTVKEILEDPARLILDV
ncbi:MAG: 2-oxoglutarate dehydrogenase complex dihydrolipoyllysine-residue succinyltransferase [Legionellales bacterium]|nr:2-oxoglutarate dehydrogenase complex dihydrolipoyllysine-residue succinyltransferase [Legionellales bacterium]